MFKHIFILNIFCLNFLLSSMDRDDKHKIEQKEEIRKITGQTQNIIKKLIEIFPGFEQLSQATKNNLANYFYKVDSQYRKIKNTDDVYKPHSIFCR